MANVSTGFLALVLHSCGQFKWIIGLYQVWYITIACVSLMYLAQFGTTFCLCTTLAETQLNSPRRDVDSRQGPGGVYRLHGNSDWLDLNVHHIGDQMAVGDIDTLSVDSVPGAQLFVRFSTVNFRQRGYFWKFFFFSFLFSFPSLSVRLWTPGND